MATESTTTEPDAEPDAEPVEQLDLGDVPKVETKKSAPASTKKRTRRRPAAPKTDAAPAKRPPGRPAKASTYAAKIRPQVEGIGGVILTVGMARGDKGAALVADGQVIMAQAEQFAEAWGELAAADPTVARVIDTLTATGQWSGVMIATMAMVLPILGNHGIGIPGLGAPPAPDTEATDRAGEADVMRLVREYERAGVTDPNPAP